MRFIGYQEYKSTNEAWLGDIPKHWDSLRIKHSLREKNAPKGSNLPCGAISFGKVVEKDSNSIPEDTRQTYQDVLKGEYLINPINLNYDLKSLRTALSRINVAVSPAYIVAVPNTAILFPQYGEYLLYLFDIAHMKTLGAGVRQTITFKDIGNCVWCVPPLDEQEQIAEFLDRETARIDSLIDKRLRFNNLLNEKLIAMATLASENVSSKKLRLGKVVDVITRPVSQETSRTYTKLGLFNRGRGIFTKDATETEDMGDSDFFWVKEGDLILSGQFAWEGAVAIADESHEGCVVSHRFPIIKGKPTIALTEYIFSTLLTDFGNFILNDCSRGSAGRNRPLNLDDLLKWKISVPPMAMQEKIANLYNLRKHMSKLVSKQIQLLEEHRSALITAAVTGKIDVRKPK